MRHQFHFSVSTPTPLSHPYTLCTLSTSSIRSWTLGVQSNFNVIPRHLWLHPHPPWFLFYFNYYNRMLSNLHTISVQRQASVVKGPKISAGGHPIPGPSLRAKSQFLLIQRVGVSKLWFRSTISQVLIILCLLPRAEFTRGLAIMGICGSEQTATRFSVHRSNCDLSHHANKKELSGVIWWLITGIVSLSSSWKNDDDTKWSSIGRENGGREGGDVGQGFHLNQYFTQIHSSAIDSLCYHWIRIKSWQRTQHMQKKKRDVTAPQQQVKLQPLHGVNCASNQKWNTCTKSKMLGNVMAEHRG